MDYYLSLANLAPIDCVALATVAEAAGFDGVTLPDHVFMTADPSRYPYSEDGTPPFPATAHWPDVWVLIGAMAAATQRLRFRTCIYVLPLRHPLLAARAISTAAGLAPGRVDVGVGAGWLEDEFDTLGVSFRDRGRRTDEAIDALRALLGPGPVSHAGERWQFGPIYMEPTPSLPVPIFVGGVSEAALNRVASRADGYIAPPLSVDDTLAVQSVIAEKRSHTSRAQEHVYFHARPTDATAPADFERLEASGIDGVQVAATPSGPNIGELTLGIQQLAEALGLSS